MFTAAQLVAFVISMIGMPYWYGTCVYICTQSLLNSKSKQYGPPKYSHYVDSRMSRYKSDIEKKRVCMDCIGMIKGFFWTNGGQGVLDYINGGAKFTNKYASNGCPDKSANGMLEWLKKQGCKNGKIATLPDVPGILLFSSGHVGVYIGGGYAVEARGFNYGVVKTKVKSRSWTEWAYLPESLLKYDGGVAPVAQAGLSKGDYGSAVTEMQKLLLKWNEYCLPEWGADGDFGTETQTAVMAFQRERGLPVTGVYDEATRSALQNLKHITQYVEITGGSVNVRNAAGTSGTKVLGVAHKGDKLLWKELVKDVGGTIWYNVDYNGADGWVSSVYSRLLAPQEAAPATEPIQETTQVVLPVQEPVSEPEKVYVVHGFIPDVSAYQVKMDAEKFASGNDWAVLRARVNGKDDEIFKDCATALAKLGFPFGVYDYLKLKSKDDAIEQADKMFAACYPFKPKFYFLDTEELADGVTYAKEAEYIKVYIQRLREWGVEVVGQYTGDDKWVNHYRNLEPDFDILWIAHWGQNTGYFENQTLKSAKYTKKIVLHQYTSYGYTKVPGAPGIEHRIDLNRLTGVVPLSYFTGRKYADEAENTAVPAEGQVEITYTVQKNDTLWAIAKNFYGDGNKYTKIVEANKLASTVIHAGEVLTIPDVQ